MDLTNSKFSTDILRPHNLVFSITKGDVICTGNLHQVPEVINL